MARRVMRWLAALVALVCLLVAGLLAPVLYSETACRPQGHVQPYAALLAPEHHRAETRSLMTYPEWHIVHAYESYGEVLRKGDPHDFGFWREITGFWRSVCTLSKASGAYGQIDGATRQLVYVIGVSFTAELLLKAAYEETVGRIFAALRGAQPAQLDALSARQAADYAAFLQQVPWYKWRFDADAKALRGQGDTLRDLERRFALGIEYRAKAGYARLIENAVSQVGPDALRLRMVVAGLTPDELADFADVSVIGPYPAGTEIETPRYRALTHLMQDMAAAGLDFVEIAGNDDILLTVLSDRPSLPGAIFSVHRQGFGDYRHLVVTKVSTLGKRLRRMAQSAARVEHIHDY